LTPSLLLHTSSKYVEFGTVGGHGTPGGREAQPSGLIGFGFDAKFWPPITYIRPR
jgi:hypothetical protein